jgi:hypothetical protein
MHTVLIHYAHQVLMMPFGGGRECPGRFVDAATGATGEYDIMETRWVNGSKCTQVG